MEVGSCIWVLNNLHKTLRNTHNHHRRLPPPPPPLPGLHSRFVSSCNYHVFVEPRCLDRLVINRGISFSSVVRYPYHCARICM
ncbi:hypothetical protein HanIR_Chr06g0281981 [Helianthus annuus]|nr:hypothetical protein HanIR_Chr06g0281981 [Helianthus annuus]